MHNFDLQLQVTKGRETLEEAKRTYEVLNAELHDELPALHDSRILFLVTNLQTLFASEQQFHSETSKVYAELEAIVDKLATESQRGSYTLKKITGRFGISAAKVLLFVAPRPWRYPYQGITLNSQDNDENDAFFGELSRSQTCWRICELFGTVST